MDGNDIGFNLQDFAPAIGNVERFMSSLSRVASRVKSFNTNGLDLNGTEKEIEGISNNLLNLVSSSSEMNNIRLSLEKMLELLDSQDFEMVFNNNPYLKDIELPPFFSNTIFEIVNTSDATNYNYYDKNGNLCGKYYSLNHLFADYTDPNNIKYKRWNPKSHTFSSISIFDNENLELNTSQYGASQLDFRYNFDNLIEDPLIWEEMQKYYPIDSFESEDTAMEFYEEYFKAISKSGCGYVADVDLVFKSYEGKEKEFEETFGYPMYTVSENGNIDFNYELFALGHFNYNNHLDGREVLIGSSLDTYDNMYNECKKLYDSFYNTSPLRVISRAIIESKYNKLKKELDNYYSDYKYPFAESGENGKVGHLDEYLKTFGIDTSFSHIESNKNLNNIINVENGIVSSYGFDLLNMDGSYYAEHGEGHFMYITGMTEDGNLIVSSWGKKFILKLDNSTYVNFDFFKINN